MIGSLFLVELLKIRRSLVRVMTLVCPLAIVGFMFLMTLRAWDPPEMTGADMARFWTDVVATWAYFMLPLFVALVTSLVNGLEHRNQTWRLMLSLPIGVDALYIAKALLALALMLCAHVILLVSIVLALWALGLFGYDLTGAFDLRSWRVLWAPAAAALPMVAIQHALAWHFRTLVPPLSIAVIATFVGMELAATKLWIWVPWSYPMVSITAQTVEAQRLAVLLAPVMALLALHLGLRQLRRREIV